MLMYESATLDDKEVEAKVTEIMGYCDVIKDGRAVRKLWVWWTAWWRIVFDVLKCLIQYLSISVLRNEYLAARSAIWERESDEMRQLREARSECAVAEKKAWADVSACYGVKLWSVLENYRKDGSSMLWTS